MPCTFKRINIIESTYPYPILKYKSRVVFFVVEKQGIEVANQTILFSFFEIDFVSFI